MCSMKVLELKIFGVLNAVQTQPTKTQKKPIQRQQRELGGDFERIKTSVEGTQSE